MSRELVLLRKHAGVISLQRLKLFLLLIVHLPQLRQRTLRFLEFRIAHLDHLAMLRLQRLHLFRVLVAALPGLRDEVFLLRCRCRKLPFQHFQLFCLLLANPRQLCQRILLFLDRAVTSLDRLAVLCRERLHLLLMFVAYLHDLRRELVLFEKCAGVIPFQCFKLFLLLLVPLAQLRQRSLRLPQRPIAHFTHFLVLPLERLQLLPVLLALLCLLGREILLQCNRRRELSLQSFHLLLLLLANTRDFRHRLFLLPQDAVALLHQRLKLLLVNLVERLDLPLVFVLRLRKLGGDLLLHRGQMPVVFRANLCDPRIDSVLFLQKAPALLFPRV